MCSSLQQVIHTLAAPLGDTVTIVDTATTLCCHLCPEWLQQRDGVAGYVVCCDTYSTHPAPPLATLLELILLQNELQMDFCVCVSLCDQLI